jgi:uncharacterized protein (TIGR02246 family)
MNRQTVLLVLALLLLLPAPFFAQKLPAKDQQAILDILSRQQAAWNAGNLEAFMKGYWESDSLMFIGSRGLTYGWQATLSNYQRSYPDRASMGKLKFDILKVKKLGKKSALVVGKWQLQRDAKDKEDLSGHFSLTWRKLKGGWVIVADHSS